MQIYPYPEQLLSCFVEGLARSLRATFRLLKPATLQEAAALAKLKEELSGPPLHNQPKHNAHPPTKPNSPMNKLPPLLPHHQK